MSANQADRIMRELAEEQRTKAAVAGFEVIVEQQRDEIGTLKATIDHMNMHMCARGDLDQMRDSTIGECIAEALKHDSVIDVIGALSTLKS